MVYRRRRETSYEQQRTEPAHVRGLSEPGSHRDWSISDLQIPATRQNKTGRTNPARFFLPSGSDYFRTSSAFLTTASSSVVFFCWTCSVSTGSPLSSYSTCASVSAAVVAGTTPSMIAFPSGE